MFGLVRGIINTITGGGFDKLLQNTIGSLFKQIFGAEQGMRLFNLALQIARMTNPLEGLANAAGKELLNAFSSVAKNNPWLKTLSALVQSPALANVNAISKFRP